VNRRIPVYILNALYLGPLTLWTYWKYGRPSLPHHGHTAAGHPQPDQTHTKTGDLEKSPGTVDPHAEHAMSTNATNGHPNGGAATAEMGHDHDKMQHETMDHQGMHHSAKGSHISHAQMHGGANVPVFAVVTIAVCHCGTGCLLGDLIGEWIVFGTNAAINGRSIWVEFLLGSYFFQYSVPFLVINIFLRLRIRLDHRNLLSVLVHCPDVRGLWRENDHSSSQGGLPLTLLLRDWPLRVDGYLPDCHLS